VSDGGGPGNHDVAGVPPGLRTEGHNAMLYRSGTAAQTASTVHTGTPTEIGAAHDAVRAWCAAERRVLTGVSWEIYGDPDPQTGHFDVAVYWQIA
jgi:hypothetical protein